MKNIVFCGSSSTGKTTILNILRAQPEFKGYHFVTEVVRSLKNSDNLKINEDGGVQTQQALFNAYKDIINDASNIPFISDRSLIDVLSYTATNASRTNNDDLKKEQSIEEAYISRLARERDDIIYIYFPIEFNTVPDGVRSTDEVYRVQVDRNMRYYLDTYIINYLTVSGTVEERLNQIYNYLNL